MKIIGTLKFGDLIDLLSSIKRNNPDKDLEVTHKDGLLDIRLIEEGNEYGRK